MIVRGQENIVRMSVVIIMSPNANPTPVSGPRMSVILKETRKPRKSTKESFQYLPMLAIGGMVSKVASIITAASVGWGIHFITSEAANMLARTIDVVMIPDSGLFTPDSELTDARAKSPPPTGKPPSIEFAIFVTPRYTNS